MLVSNAGIEYRYRMPASNAGIGDALHSMRAAEPSAR
jgi:hypothetical protein